MGLYDYLVSECPNCHKEATSQTKMFESALRCINKGDLVDDMEHIQVDILCKNSCDHCGALLVARFRNNIFEGFVISKATYQELLFGEIKNI